MKVYTKKGDEGLTTVFGGVQASKTSHLLGLGGGVDELNSFIGLLISRLERNFTEDVPLLKTIQNQLFIMGTRLTTTAEQRKKQNFPDDVDKDVIECLEKRIDVLDEKLPPLKNFIIPGGDMRASLTHVCRSLCRRIERDMAHTKMHTRGEDLVSFTMMAMMNRLSDYLFVFARYVNFECKRKDDIWKH